MLRQEGLFTYEICENDLVITLEGEIDHHSAVSVRKDIDELIFDLRPKRVILNLSSISFMDSSGLGLIMGRYSLVKELGGSLLLQSPSVAVMKILSLAGMDKMIKIEASSKEDKNNEE